MKKANNKIGYAIGTIFATVFAAMLSIAILGLIGIGILRIWMYVIDLMQAIF